MAFTVKIRTDDGRWRPIIRTESIRDALDAYNDAPVPRLIVGRRPDGYAGVLHKQYTDNGFHYSPEWADVL